MLFCKKLYVYSYWQITFSSLQMTLKYICSLLWFTLLISLNKNISGLKKGMKTWVFVCIMFVYKVSVVKMMDSKIFPHVLWNWVLSKIFRIILQNISLSSQRMEVVQSQSFPYWAPGKQRASQAGELLSMVSWGHLDEILCFIKNMCVSVYAAVALHCHPFSLQVFEAIVFLSDVVRNVICNWGIEREILLPDLPRKL